MPGRYLSLHLWACGFVSPDVIGLGLVLQKLLHATKADLKWTQTLNQMEGKRKEGHN